MNEKLIEYSKKLKLGKEFLEEYDTIPFTTKEEYLKRIFEVALNYRKINAKNRLLKLAKKTFDDYDFKEIDFPETIGVQEIQELEFISRQENLILYGPVGTGKTHLATAIGVSACIAGKKVRFYKVANLVNELVEAYEKSELRKFMSSLKKYDLLICDEWGYIPLETKGAELLFQVIADCYERKSLIITTNLEFGKWNSIFLDKKLTAAIIDRIIHHSHLITFTGESYRLRNSIINSD